MKLHKILANRLEREKLIKNKIRIEIGKTLKMLRFHEDYIFDNSPCYFGYWLDTVRQVDIIKYSLVLYCVIPEDEYNTWNREQRLDFKLKMIEDLTSLLYRELEELVELNNIHVVSSKE